MLETKIFVALWLGYHVILALTETTAPTLLIGQRVGSWWRHQIETFSRYWPFVWANHRAQRPVTRSFDVSFDLRLNKRLRKLSWRWWFEALSRPLWRHCNVSCTQVRVIEQVEHLLDDDSLDLRKFHSDCKWACPGLLVNSTQYCYVYICPGWGNALQSTGWIRRWSHKFANGFVTQGTCSNFECDLWM